MDTVVEDSLRKTIKVGCVDLIIQPVFMFLYWVLLCPTKIVYNISQGQYECIVGGKLRKTVCILFNAFVPINTFINFKSDIGKRGGTLQLMYKIAYMGYFSFGFVFHNLAFRKSNQICDIFNQLVELRRAAWANLGKFDLRKSRINQMTFARALVSVTFVISTCEHLFGNERIDENVNSDCEEDTPVLSYIKNRGLHGCFFIVTNAWRSFCFNFMDLLLTCWGLQFRQMLVQVCQNMESRQFPMSSREKMECIHLYIKFTSVLEKFNETNGSLVLSGIFSETMYWSINSVSFATEDKNNSIAHRIGVVASYIPFFLAIVAASEVNRMAKRFTSLLKKDFEQGLAKSCTAASLLTVQPQTPPCQMISEALTHIYHDIATNAIGFQGLGLFTVTYGFVGSIITAITTYSIVILQLSEK